MGAKPVNTLEITIQRKSGAKWPVVVETSRPGVLLPTRSESVFDLDEEAFQALTSLLGQPRDYGNRLGRALFQDSVRDAFVGALRESEDQLRILLCIEAEDLRSLRWERLGAPIDSDWSLLARDQRTPFSLYIPSTTDRRFPPIGRRDLRALLLVASPADSGRYRLAPFDVEATVASVTAALGTIPCDVLANVDGAIGPPSIDELCARLTARNVHYTLLHVVCHGKQLDGGETALYWANTANQVELVTATALLERLRTVGGPRGLPHFAFLAACESASAQAEGALEGLAQRLVREVGMPAVLAMTEKVTMKTAAALAEAFYRQLSASGQVDTALPEATAALARRGDILVPALFSRLGGRPLFSDQLDRELTNEEIRFGLDRLDAILEERAPVLKSEIKAQVTTVAGTLDADATALSRDARLERRQALDTINTLSQEALDLSFNALALGQRPPDYDARCPFRGLYPFRPEDREFFFGRESLIEQLRRKLAGHNFLPILGPSGSGKSSLVFAGLIAALRRCEEGLQVADLNPGSAPLPRFETAAAKLSDQTSVLVVDQFEEVFTLCADKNEREAFIGRMLGIARNRRVVLTMRADFWGECASHTDLKGLMEAHQILIAPMDFAELRNAVDRQARQVGLRFEAGLIDRVLDEVQGEPGAMPLLQHALLELWKRRRGRWLRADEYTKIGGVRKAIARTADDVYDRLSSDEQWQFRNIFVRLTRLDSTAVQGERRRDTRRRLRIEELAPAEAEPLVTERLVQRLAGQDARLVVTSIDEMTQREMVEVAHEALIRHWPRLRTWLDEDRANFLLRDAIHQASEDWQQHARETSYLIHSGSRLDDAEALSRRPGFLNANEQAYVQACADLRARQDKEKADASNRELEAARKLVEQETKARKAAQTRTRFAYTASAIVLSVTMFSFVGWRQAEVNEIQAMNDKASTLFQANQQIEGLVEAVKAGREVLGSSLLALWPDTALNNDVNTTVQQLLPKARQHNRLYHRLVAGVAFAPDDQALAIWTKGLRWELLKPDGAAYDQPWLRDIRDAMSVAFSHDGKIAVAGPKGVALHKLHDSEPWTYLTRMHSSIVALSDDGTMIAAAPLDRGTKIGRVTIWHTDEGSSLLLEGHGMGIPEALAFSPDGTQIAVAGSTGAFLWKTDGSATEPVKLGTAPNVHAVAFSPDNKMIATGGSETTISLWQADGTLVKTLSSHTDAVWGLAFRSDSQVVASASADSTVKLWQTDGTLLTTLVGRVRTVAFSHDRDGTTLASPMYDNTVRLWELGGPAQKALTLDDEVSTAVFSPPDGGLILTTSGKGWVTFWKPDGTVLRKQQWHNGPITAATFSRDGKLVATASLDGPIRLTRTDGGLLGAKVDLLAGQTDGAYKGAAAKGVTALGFSPEGKWLAAGGFSRKVQVWNTSEPDKPPTLLHETTQPVSGIDFSPDGGHVVISDFSGAVVIVSSKDGSLVKTLQQKGDPIRDVRYAPDGNAIAAASNDNTVKLWKADGTLVKTLTGDNKAVLSVAFSPDGKTIASAGVGGTVKLWTADGTLMKTLTGHNGAVLSVAFSPDGKTVVSAGEDGTAILQNWQDDQSLDGTIARTCDWLKDYLANSAFAEKDRKLCAGLSRR